jgi:hypothetical protein
MAPPLSIEDQEKLYKLFYVDHNYFGRDKLFELCKDRNYNISRRQVQDWLVKQESYQLHLATQYATKSRIKSVVADKLKKDDVKFKIGDDVRVVISKTKEIVENPKINWSKKIYRITKVGKPQSNISATFYHVNGISEKLYNNDLQLITSVENIKQKEVKYEISKLLRPSVSHGEAGYIVKWKRYRKSIDNTWESEKMLMEDAPKLLKQFIKKHDVKFYEYGNKLTFTWVE